VAGQQHSLFTMEVLAAALGMRGASTPFCYHTTTTWDECESLRQQETRVLLGRD